MKSINEIKEYIKGKHDSSTMDLLYILSNLINIVEEQQKEINKLKPKKNKINPYDTGNGRRF